MRSSGITVYTETPSSFIPFILHEEIHEILPVLIPHPEDKELFEQFYMQKARRSSIQSTKTYKAFQAFQPQDLTQAFQFYKDIPDIPVIHDIPTLQVLLHVPAPSSTIQYLPVLSSVSRDSTHSSISSIRMLILHTDWFTPETPLSASRIQDITLLQTFILQRKGDVAISVKR